MSRAKVQTSEPTTNELVSAVPPLNAEPGLEGPYSKASITISDPRVRQELERLLEASRNIRSTLRERQQQTEEDGQYAEDIHAYFLEHGFYKVLLPRIYGGLELGIGAFFTVIAEVARGCPSTAWCLSLSCAHTVTLASYFPKQAQDEVFGANGYMIAPASGNPRAATVRRVDGGIMLSGSWRYCSGAPYSTHFFPTVEIPETETEDAYQAWVVVERKDYEVLDDWGRVIGMRGSGSNGIQMSEVFVPDHRIVREAWANELTEPAPGSKIHGNPTYSGTFFGFAEGEVAAVAVGLGYAMADEYERIIRTSRAPFDSSGRLRAESGDWQRVLGMSIARVDAAHAALVRTGDLYEEYARQLIENGEPFDGGRSMRMNSAYFVVEELIWDAAQEMIRTAGTGASAEGQKMQRYFRDAWTTQSRTDQFQFFAAPAMQFHFEHSSPAPANR
ncbi:MAG: acyl-CoA dehydrogenase family protein [Gulosibacter sp.]|uniref:acyl-CoA dehydrogenase family protein n=1 Tax=Gulosibacter sp. TaxID=2817531 RepID=UPI003F917E10